MVVLHLFELGGKPRHLALADFAGLPLSCRLAAEFIGLALQGDGQRHGVRLFGLGRGRLQLVNTNCLQGRYQCKSEHQRGEDLGECGHSSPDL